MKLYRFLPQAVLVLPIILATSVRPEEQKAVKVRSFDSSHGLTIKVRMEGPYDADTPLQIVCYFKHKKSGIRTWRCRRTGQEVWRRHRLAPQPW